MRKLRRSKVVKDTGFETSRPQFKSSFVTGMWQILSKLWGFVPLKSINTYIVRLLWRLNKLTFLENA